MEFDGLVIGSTAGVDFTGVVARDKEGDESLSSAFLQELDTIAMSHFSAVSVLLLLERVGDVIPVCGTTLDVIFGTSVLFDSSSFLAVSSNEPLLDFLLEDAWSRESFLTNSC